MAHLVLNLHAYDCLDSVQIIIDVKDYDEPFDSEEYALRWASTIPSRGAETKGEWLRDVLVAVVESL